MIQIHCKSCNRDYKYRQQALIQTPVEIRALVSTHDKFDGMVTE